MRAKERKEKKNGDRKKTINSIVPQIFNKNKSK